MLEARAPMPKPIDHEEMLEDSDDPPDEEESRPTGTLYITRVGAERLREIDRRLRFLDKRLEKLTVVEPGAQKDTSRIFFGATVALENEEDGSKVSYQLVGPDETDLKTGKISVDSPVGRALLGKKAGDVVTVHRPKGEVDFAVVTIKYV